ncbi:MAG: gluconeogenesis factor YvcK family protein [Aeromicrobium sp.]
MKVVALGGGHGLAASLSALRLLHTDLTGVVTVADNGGSSGRLRDELGVLPPGDLRMALAALCADDEWGRQWAAILQHRFDGDGPLRDHAVGNLLIAAIWDILGDHVGGLDLVGELLGARGRVLPMSAVPLDIEADVHLRSAPDRLTVVRGQVQVAEVDGQVVSVRLDPVDPPACPEAVEAVKEADWVVIGPGSWFTSVMPTLLVPELRDALVSTSARRVLVLNLQEQEGETEGLSPTDHLEVLSAHAPDLGLDTVVADSSLLDGRGSLAGVARELGARLVTAELAREPGSDQHDPQRLSEAFHMILASADMKGP